MRKGEKLLVTSNFSFPHNAFHSFVIQQLKYISSMLIFMHFYERTCLANTTLKPLIHFNGGISFCFVFLKKYSI